MFLAEGRFKQYWFNAKIDLGDGLKWWSWKDFFKKQTRDMLGSDDLQASVVQVTGALSEIIDLLREDKLDRQIADIRREAAREIQHEHLTKEGRNPREEVPAVFARAENTVSFSVGEDEGDGIFLRTSALD